MTYLVTAEHLFVKLSVSNFPVYRLPRRFRPFPRTSIGPLHSVRRLDPRGRRCRRQTSAAKRRRCGAKEKGNGARKMEEYILLFSSSPPPLRKSKHWALTQKPPLVQWTGLPDAINACGGLCRTILQPTIESVRKRVVILMTFNCFMRPSGNTIQEARCANMQGNADATLIPSLFRS